MTKFEIKILWLFVKPLQWKVLWQLENLLQFKFVTVGKTVTFPKFFNFEITAVKPLHVTTVFAEKVSPTKI